MSDCELCSAPKVARECEECGRGVCKNCLCYLEPERLRFYPDPLPFGAKTTFCADCFERLVAPEITRYDEALERSYAITKIRASFRGYLPTLRKATRITEVHEETDRNLAVARLCFLAAWNDYDAVAELFTKNKKVRNHGWEKKSWSARGLFLCLDYKRFRPPEESD